MMGLLIGLLTVVMVVDCVILIFLVLIQLPKKDAGAGLAFGASATDALFGAGSGTVLTKITKYAATAFFAMAILLSVMQSTYHRRAGSQLLDALDRPGSGPPPLAQPMTPPTATGATSNAATLGSATNPSVQPSAESPNLPVPIPSSNPPSGPATPK